MKKRKKQYRKPSLVSQSFVPNAYCSQCGNKWYIDVGKSLGTVYFDNLTDNEEYSVGYFNNLEARELYTNPNNTIPENPPYFQDSPREVGRIGIKIYKDIDYDNGVEGSDGKWHYPYKDPIEHLYEVQYNGLIYYFEEMQKTSS